MRGCLLCNITAGSKLRDTRRNRTHDAVNIILGIIAISLLAASALTTIAEREAPASCQAQVTHDLH